MLRRSSSWPRGSYFGFHRTKWTAIALESRVIDRRIDRLLQLMPLPITDIEIRHAPACDGSNSE